MSVIDISVSVIENPEQTHRCLGRKFLRFVRKVLMGVISTSWRCTRRSDCRRAEEKNGWLWSPKKECVKIVSFYPPNLSRKKTEKVRLVFSSFRFFTHICVNTFPCKPPLACMSQTCTVGGINSFHCVSETLSSSSSCYLWIDTKNLLTITDLVDCQTWKSLLCTVPLFYPSHHFPSTFLLFTQLLSFFSCLSDFFKKEKKKWFVKKSFESDILQKKNTISHSFKNVLCCSFRWRSTSHLFLQSAFLTVCTAPWHRTTVRARCLTLVRCPVTCPNPRWSLRHLMIKVRPDEAL